MNDLLKTAFLVLLFAFTASAQTKNSVVCHQKQLWLVSQTQAVSIGKCAGGKTWVAPVSLDEQTADRKKSSGYEKQVSDALRQTTKEWFKPVPLAQAAEIAQALQSDPNKSAVTLNSNSLPRYVKDFFNPSVEFTITRGVIFSDNTYREDYNFKIKLPSANPTIAEMVEEVRKNNPLKKQVEQYGKYYYLNLFDSKEKLDPQKRASDYNLKNGDKLILSFDTRKALGLPDGIR